MTALLLKAQAPDGKWHEITVCKNPELVFGLKNAFITAGLKEEQVIIEEVE